MPVSFTQKTLGGTLAISTPTALQWGPDGRLYVLSRAGQLDVVTVQKDAAGSYAIQSQAVVGLVAGIPNHDDDGTFNPGLTTRQATGLVVTGTAERPVVYVSSSDPRGGGGAAGTDSGLDTNSGTISRLTLVDGAWQKVDIVRGLPRSEADHATNGLALADDGHTLLVAQGGQTNAGAPSNNLAGNVDYALSGAILSVDLGKIAAIEAAGLKIYAPATGIGQSYVYDLPTLNDPTRADGPDGADLPGSGTIGGDPFGGHDGLNMARLVEGGPVQIHMAGFRNPYDVLVTQDGRAWSYDNGPATTQGGPPLDQNGERYTGADGQVATNLPNEATYGIVNNSDQLHELVAGGYAGSPNLIRAFGAAAGLLRSPGAGTSGAALLGADDLPVDFAGVVPAALLDRRQALYREGGVADGAVDSTTGSTNGLAEYTASTLVSDGAGGTRSIKGALLATNFQNNQLILIDRYANGDGAVETGFASGKAVAENRQVISVAGRPLGIDAVGDDGLFAGTIWISTFSGSRIVILEPGAGSDYAPVVISGGGGAAGRMDAAENGTAIGTVTATDVNGGPIGYTITGGADAALFTIGASSGALAFRAAQDFERPGDADRDGVYQVVVRASDGALAASQTIAVRLTNVIETQSRVLTNAADRFVAPSDDHWIVNAGLGNDSVTTAGGNDRITGGGGDDRLAAGAGDDLFLFSGASGVDTIDGGAGNDTIQAIATNATLNWGAYTGVEAISAGGFANVRILGGAGGDTIDLTGITLTGIAVVDGGAGNDSITGSDGGDTLAGGAGDDRLTGAAGDDIFLFAGASGSDTIDGGAGSDTIRATAANSVLNWGAYTDVEAISAGGFANVRIMGTAAADMIDLSPFALSGIAAIDGGAGNDSITGSGGADTIVGNAGADRLAGGDGDDLFLFAGASGSDTIDGGAGSDTIRATAANSVLNWGAYTDVEAISGGGFANVRIIGTAGADVIDLSGIALSGIAGIVGGLGADTLTASGAADRFVYATLNDSRAGVATDSIIGFEDGIDRIDLSALDANSRVAGAQDFSFIGEAAFTRTAGQLRIDRTDPSRTVVQGDVDGNGVADVSLTLIGAHPLTAGDFVL